MPKISPIGERTSKYLDIPESARGPAVDRAKGYRLQDLGDGLFTVTDNTYQSMFLVYDRGVVVVDAPPNYAKRIPIASRSSASTHSRRSGRRSSRHSMSMSGTSATQWNRDYASTDQPIDIPDKGISMNTSYLLGNAARGAAVDLALGAAPALATAADDTMRSASNR